MFDNSTTRNQPPPTNLPTNEDKAEDIFVNTDKGNEQSGSSDFKVKIPIPSSPPAPQDQGESQGGSASPARLGGPKESKSIPEIKDEFGDFKIEDKKINKKKYFIIGLIGLLIIGAGAFAYWIFHLNTESIKSFPVNQGQILEDEISEPEPQPQAVKPQPSTQRSDTGAGEILPKKDLDLDGLTDKEEAIFGTDPNLTDTDNDGLFDREEVRVYLTNPLDPDTDSDGYLDGEEVKNGYNPKGEGKLLPLPQ